MSGIVALADKLSAEVRRLRQWRNGQTVIHRPSKDARPASVHQCKSGRLAINQADQSRSAID
ncbi:hypothetical protein [Paraburkholderia antibiotica]|uniref:Uncharacterized protein n=1 Tax=Paraburkholderia antibiotica TaxID=2728839 RepID=A0A7X9ZXN5_9BURK|nr:hypothetical protein [Paraburkholderia antibiotica]NML32242.1 hypothetical protein [Paraburkholderia antibiotica]